MQNCIDALVGGIASLNVSSLGILIVPQSNAHRKVATRWTPSGEWMLDTILCTF